MSRPVEPASINRPRPPRTAILDFPIPERFHLNLSSLSTPQFATTYTLGTIGLIDGTISYLYTTLPLTDTPSRSTLVPLRKLVPGYRQVPAPAPRPSSSSSTSNNVNSDSAEQQQIQREKESLVFATIHLPPPTTLTALFLRQLSPRTKLSLALSSTRAEPIYKNTPPASVLAQLQRDTGKYSVEALFSTDNSLFGLKGLWNFYPLPRVSNPDSGATLISAGGELYYSPFSSVVGLSTGLRFTTLPPLPPPLPPSAASVLASASASASEPAPVTPQSALPLPTSPPSSNPPPSPPSTIPYTLTLTLTPFTGSLSTTYSILASQNLAFSSRFDFNAYSWESRFVAGMELWRRRRADPVELETDNFDWARRKLGIPVLFPVAGVDPEPEPELEPARVPAPALPPPVYARSHEGDSVIKVRVDQAWNVRVLWEGKVKELVVSAGLGLGPLARPSLAMGSPGRNGLGSGSGVGVLGNGNGNGSGGRAEGPSSSSLSWGPSYGWTGIGVSILYSS